MRLDYEYLQIQYNRYIFLPTVDGKEIPADPTWFLENAHGGGTSVASPVPYLTGVNQDDGTEVICMYELDNL